MALLTVADGEFSRFSGVLEDAVTEIATPGLGELAGLAEESMPASVSGPRLRAVAQKLAREVRERSAVMSADSDSFLASDAEFRVADELHRDAMWLMMP